MILLVDSGSTKSDWFLVESNGTFVDSYKTRGFNPYFHTSKFISTEIGKNKSILGMAEHVTQIYYYGAGCSNDQFKEIVKIGLSEIFPKAVILVEHDLMAAIYASYEGQPCISCILGTGSNSAYFDGQHLTTLNSGLGYILGDEGSGSYFGKKLLAAFLYRQLPAAIIAELESEFGLDRATIIKNVYEKPGANVYLAGFTRFIAKHQDLPVFQEMLYKGMKEFLEVHVCGYANYKEVKTHFIGSIAFYFQAHIERAAADLGITVGQIIKSPIQKLLEYHVKNVFHHA